ncbi:MAG: helix-turn-helix transcriptional regulator, partial [bacterium]|nr:helix-turn-helix transcriptional regulator [bacterium]
MNTVYKESVGRRLELLRDTQGLSPGAMAARMNISLWAYRQQKNGIHLPSLAGLRTLVKEHKLSLDWLYTGRGSMFFRDIDQEKKQATEEAVAAERAARKAEQAAVKAIEDENLRIAALLKENDLFHQEMEEMKRIMKRVPAIRYEVMGYFQKVKVEQKELIREESANEAALENTAETPDALPAGNGI